MKRVAALVGAGLLSITSCRTPLEGFDAARARMNRGDLIGALVHLDRVPPADPSYAEARSLAGAVERRIRTSQRLFARGLMLRAQWLDEEAIESFELARDVWPGLVGVDSLIVATRERVKTLTEPAADQANNPIGEVAITAPVESAAGADVADTGNQVDPTEDPVAPDQAVDPRLATAPPPAPSVETRPSGAAETPARDPSVAGPARAAEGREVEEAILRARLGQARSALRAGRIGEALSLLHDLHERYPARHDVAAMRVRVLHQRALLLYGQGELAQAVAAWRQLLEADPTHRQAREFYASAKSELDAVRRRSR